MSKCLKKFEYTRIYCEVDHNELDMMGEAGWELVAIELSKSVGLPTLWFKREKQEVKYENVVSYGGFQVWYSKEHETTGENPAVS